MKQSIINPLVVFIFIVFVNEANSSNILMMLTGVWGAAGVSSDLTYQITDTGQVSCYDTENVISSTFSR